MTCMGMHGMPIWISIPNFIKNGQTIFGILQFSLLYWLLESRKSMLVSIRISIKMGQTVFEMVISSIVSKPAVRYLVFVGVKYGPPRVLHGVYGYEKFGWYQCISFHNMKVLIFCTFVLKTLIHAPKCFWGIDLLNRQQDPRD